MSVTTVFKEAPFPEGLAAAGRGADHAIVMPNSGLLVVFPM